MITKVIVVLALVAGMLILSGVIVLIAYLTDEKGCEE